jgi:hypothetical protein
MRLRELRKHRASDARKACLISLDSRRRLLAARRQAVPASFRLSKGADKEIVGFYSANDFVITSRGERYPGSGRFRMHLDALADPGRAPKHLTLKPIGGL